MTLLYLTSFILGMLGALTIAYFGNSLGLVDIPNHRSSHVRPTPKGGGIGILAAFLLACIITHQPPPMYICATLISLLGFYGDYKELSASFRLTFHFSATLLILLGYFTSGKFIDFPPMLLLPLWLIFIVGTANFYNFMDGINGIAAITGAIAFGLLAILIQHNSIDTLAAPLALCLALACLGFLPLNFPHARVFMGDTGSVLLGFIFGVLVATQSQTILDFICYSSLLFPFYIDELSTMYIRLKNGENLTHAHRRHLYQILANEKSIPHWKISTAYGIFQLITAIGVMSLRTSGLIAVIAFLLLLFCCFVVLSNFIRKRL